MTHVKNVGDVESPDAPPVLTVAELRAQGHAREITWVSGKTQRTAIQITPEGHRLLGENQRARAAANRAHRESRS